MAIFLGRRMVLAAKIENTEGTAEALAGTDANLLVYDAMFEPDQDQFERKPLANDLSPFGPIAGKRKATIRFKAELKGSGTAGTAPAIGKLLKACGASEATVAATSVTYAPLTLAIPTLTIGLYSVPESGNSIKEFISGARGSWKLSPNVGDPGMLEFEFTGNYETTADITSITPSGLESTKPQPFLSTSLSCHSSSGHKISKFSFDLKNQLAMRTDINKASGYFSCLIVDRAPSFSFDPEKELVATHDYYGKVFANTEASLSLTIGASAGNIATLSAPKAQYVQVKPGVRDGIQIFNVDGRLNRSSGNDEWSLAFT